MLPGVIRFALSIHANGAKPPVEPDTIVGVTRMLSFGVPWPRPFP
jgi:hypothetical protein